MKRRIPPAAALLGTVTAPAPAGTARAAAPGPSATRGAATALDSRAIRFACHDGLVNNNPFRKNGLGLLTHRGHQYAVRYTADRNAAVGRRALGAGTRPAVRVGHTLRFDDSHDVISMGLSRTGGRLRLDRNSHSGGLTPVKSVAGLMDDPAGLIWTASGFGAPRSTLDGLAPTSQFPYPQFVAMPGGTLQLSHRTGVRGNGRRAPAGYDGTAWTNLGGWSSSTGTYTSRHGSSTVHDMCPHGIGHDRNGRLPFGRVVAASAASGQTDRTTLFDGSGRNAFGEVVVDGTRLVKDGVLSVLYQVRSTGTTSSALRVVDFGVPA